MRNEHNNAPAVPQGWAINETDDGHLNVLAPVGGPGGMAIPAGNAPKTHAVRLLEALARAVLAATPAPAPAQEPDMHIGACITDGVLHATVMRREANGDVTALATAEMAVVSLERHDCIAKMAAPAQERCHLCDCTGDIHDATGEWRGECPHCKPAQEVGLTDEALDKLVEDLSDWFGDTAHQTLEAHVREVLAKNPIIAALRAKGIK